MTYEGRRNGTTKLINITHKAPILLESHTPIYFFPTKSPQHELCVWIAHDQVKSSRKGDTNTTTVVTFRNNGEYTVSISVTPFKTQMLRTAMLRIEYEKSIERIEMYNLLKQSYFMKASEEGRPYRPYK
ncbi:competence protein ComK [Bacillus sp. J14TS2]|uniref:competence protein ComK n=1 Tax=Bacillus sp. J14TS2 TaxID=2807188 RepID=UPI0035B51591